MNSAVIDAAETLKMFSYEQTSKFSSDKSTAWSRPKLLKRVWGNTIFLNEESCQFLGFFQKFIFGKWLQSMTLKWLTLILLKYFTILHFLFMLLLFEANLWCNPLLCISANIRLFYECLIIFGKFVFIHINLRERNRYFFTSIHQKMSTLLKVGLRTTS